MEREPDERSGTPRGEPGGHRWRLVLAAGFAAVTVEVTLGRPARAALAAANAGRSQSHLEGTLSICASCKRIRDERGNWTSIEVFISQRSAARFSHGLCDDCLGRELGKLG